MKQWIQGFITLCVLVGGTLLVAWHLPTPSVAHDPPRDLPWPLADHRLAEKAYQYLADGRIQVTTHHLPLPGITPAMLAWFYQQLPISTVDLDGTTYPLYHLFHPTEHGRLRVVTPAPDGTPGMAQGAVIMREEWFGSYDSRGEALISAFSESGMTAVASTAGLAVGVIEHRYTVVDGATRYTVHATIGSDAPLIGGVLNAYLRHRVFTPEMMAQWMRHQVEEVASMVHFLPELYAQRSGGNHFTLTREMLSR